MIDFVHQGRFPGINEWNNAQRRSSYLGNQMKRDEQEVVEWELILQNVQRPLKEPIQIVYKFFEPNMKRDKDNIAGFAHKIVQDALVKTHFIQNDGWQNINAYSDYFFIDKANPRVEVLIFERGEH